MMVAACRITHNCQLALCMHEAVRHTCPCEGQKQPVPNTVPGQQPWAWIIRWPGMAEHMHAWVTENGMDGLKEL